MNLTKHGCRPEMTKYIYKTFVLTFKTKLSQTFDTRLNNPRSIEIAAAWKQHFAFTL